MRALEALNLAYKRTYSPIFLLGMRTQGHYWNPVLSLRYQIGRIVLPERAMVDSNYRPTGHEPGDLTADLIARSR